MKLFLYTKMVDSVHEVCRPRLDVCPLVYRWSGGDWRGFFSLGVAGEVQSDCGVGSPLTVSLGATMVVGNERRRLAVTALHKKPDAGSRSLWGMARLGQRHAAVLDCGSRCMELDRLR